MFNQFVDDFKRKALTSTVKSKNEKRSILSQHQGRLICRFHANCYLDI